MLPRSFQPECEACFALVFKLSLRAERQTVYVLMSRLWLQQRALVTYIKRIYYPFLVREPELINVAGHLCAIWLHSLNCSRTASVGTVVLGIALVIPSLQDLPNAITSVEELILQSGELLGFSESSCTSYLEVQLLPATWE